MRIAASLIRSAGRSNPLCIIMTVTLRCRDFLLNPKVQVRFRDAPVDVWPQQLLEDHLTPELHCWSRFCCRLSSQDRKHQHQTYFQNKITLAKESFFCSDAEIWDTRYIFYTLSTNTAGWNSEQLAFFFCLVWKLQNTELSL